MHLISAHLLRLHNAHAHIITFHALVLSRGRCRAVNVSSNDLPDLHFMHFRLRNDCMFFFCTSDWLNDWLLSKWHTAGGLGELEEGNESLWTFSVCFFLLFHFTPLVAASSFFLRCTVIEDRALHFPQLKLTIVKSQGKDVNSCPCDVDGPYIFFRSNSLPNYPRSAAHNLLELPWEWKN